MSHHDIANRDTTSPWKVDETVQVPEKDDIFQHRPPHRNSNSIIVSNIVNGNQASPGDFPYFVHMGTCGATLIAPDLVLTAAHCGDRTYEQLQIGAYRKQRDDGGAQSRFCDRWIPHPEWQGNRIIDGHDFALCLLDRPVDIDQSKVTLELNEYPDLPSGGDEVIVVGLGLLAFSGTGPEFLQFVDEPALSNQQCEAVYGEFPGQDGLLCIGDLAGGRGACPGDSGGPAVRRTLKPDGTMVDTHVGLVSFSVIDEEDPQCAQPDSPVVYARTSSEIDWIRETACNELGSRASFCPDTSESLMMDDIDCNRQNRYELEVEINTSAFQGRYNTGFYVQSESTERLKTFRTYLLKNFKNTHTLCLGVDKRYNFVASLDVFATYTVRLNGQVILDGFGDDQDLLRFTIQTPDESPRQQLQTRPTAAPTLPPTAKTVKTAKKGKGKKATKKQRQMMGQRRTTTATLGVRRRA